MHQFYYHLTKKPVLVIGIICMALFLYKADFKKIINDHNNKLNSYSCNAVLIPLDRNIPKSWKTKCIENDLEIVATLEEDIIDKAVKNNSESKEQDKIMLSLHYRELANILMVIAKHSPNYTLERTGNIKVILETKKFKIAAYTHGSYLFKLSEISNPEMIAEHLKATVQIKQLSK